MSSLLIISKNYWGANMSEKTAYRVKEIFSNFIENDKIDSLIGDGVNTITVKNKLKDWIKEKCSNSKIMFIYINGHGNQTLDRNGEEKDNFDELLQLPDGNILDDEFTDIINRSVTKYEETKEKPIIFLISDHCSSGSMLDNIPNLNYNWITIGSSLDYQDSLMTGDGNVMTTFLLDIINDLIKKNKLVDITTIELYDTLRKQMLESFVGELQVPTLNVSCEKMYNTKPFN